MSKEVDQVYQANSNLKKLKEIYKSHGICSEEFEVQVRGFICFLMIRYNGRVKDDLAQDCYEKVLRSMQHYDEEKYPNVGTFIYSVVRNQITNYIYMEKKHSASDLPDWKLGIDLPSVIDHTNQSMELDRKLIDLFPKIQFDQESKEQIKHDIAIGYVSVYTKYITWMTYALRN